MGNYVSWIINTAAGYLNWGSAPKALPKPITNDKIDKLAKLSGFSKDEVREWHDGFIKDCPGGQLNKQKFIETYSVRLFALNGQLTKLCSYLF
ncbi:unnamed protein product [Didymodactylos carnosus]|uniref:Uncharacterized protein n=1 Tax=Didymodactylos carnosus TaxID=1234261 RepID=A0A8S2FIT5_9BILA|nr:unnamed protein product [Didymodactylos carnosus]CAF4259846.1 unnamed protein product [Didymodactylos carnosus]